MADGHIADGDHVRGMFAAIEARDLKAFSDCFGPNAVFWRCNDELEQDIPAVAAGLSHLFAVSSRTTYSEQKIVAAGKFCFVWHILLASLNNGGELRQPTMMRFELADDGRIARVDAYFDSRKSDVLATA